MPAVPSSSASPPPDAGRTRVLMIDDDRKLCRLIADYLAPLGFDLVPAHTGPDGVDQALLPDATWHAVILDVMLPGLDGFEVLKAIRRSSTVPILMLTARGEETDRIVGLEVGADDYLPKTFSMRELLARLRAVLRRTRNASAPAGAAPLPAELVAGPIRLNLDARAALFEDLPLVLTPVEFDLLAGLMRSRGRIKTREALLDEIRDRNYEVFDRSIDVHISALRRKLHDDAKDPRFIRTVRSAGYLFMEERS